MAWRNVGRFYLAAGRSVNCWVSWNAPGDQGPQWIMAHAARGQEPTKLAVSGHAKKLDYGIGWVRSDGSSGWDHDSIYYTYWVKVTNEGTRGVTFSLEGGGV